MSMNNAAHDYEFDRFSAAEQPQQRTAQPPELRVVKARQQRDNAFLTSLAILFGCTLILFAAVIYNNMVLTELTTKMEGIQTEYDMLKDDYKRMQVELEGKLSTRTVEDIASSRLGMAKAESYQIKYVDLQTNSKVLFTREATPTAGAWIDKAANLLREYWQR